VPLNKEVVEKSVLGGIMSEKVEHRKAHLRDGRYVYRE
jgi:hypothetical protein